MVYQRTQIILELNKSILKIFLQFSVNIEFLYNTRFSALVIRFRDEKYDSVKLMDSPNSVHFIESIHFEYIFYYNFNFIKLIINR